MLTFGSFDTAAVSPAMARRHRGDTRNHRTIRRVEAHHIGRKDADTKFGRREHGAAPAAAAAIFPSDSLLVTTAPYSDAEVHPTTVLAQRNGQTKDEFLREREIKLALAKQARADHRCRSEGDENLANLIRRMTVTEGNEAKQASERSHAVQETALSPNIRRQQKKQITKKPFENATRSDKNAQMGMRHGHHSRRPQSDSSGKRQRSEGPKPRSRSAKDPIKHRGIQSETTKRAREPASARGSKARKSNSVLRAQAQVEISGPYTKKPQTRAAIKSGRIVAPPGGRSSLRFG